MLANQLQNDFLEIQRIQLSVCKCMGVRMEDLLSDRRFKKFSWPRQICYFLCWGYTKKTLTVIGRHFNRDHSTIIKGIEKVANHLEKYPSLQVTIDAIKEEINKRVERTMEIRNVG